MQVKYRQYPHPVLSYFSDDLVNCAFQSALKITTTRTTYIFEAICKTSSKDLVNLINKQHAYYSFHIECPSTRYRKIVTSSLNTFSFEISADKIDGKVQICSFIIAADDLPKYRNSNFHPDYGNISFRVKKGDVLAVDRDRTIFVDKEIDPLKKIPSIFTVCKNNGKDAPPCDIDASGNKVAIMLSEDNYTRYKILKINQNLHKILASLFILPALVSLLEIVKVEIAQSGGIDEYEERRWFRILANKLKTIGIDLRNPNSFSDSTLLIAQKLIGDPLTGSLKALEEYESES